MNEIPQDVREEFDDILATKPEAAAAAAEMRRIAAEDPGIVEVALHRIEDEETLADPRVQESIRQMETGELVDIPLLD